MSDTPQQFHFTADRGDARLRLDQALVRRMGREMRLSRTQAQHWIEAGRVSLDGEAARRSSQSVVEGATVVVELPSGVERRQAPQPEDIALDVLYEDEHIIVVNKPPGVVVHPTYKHASNTIINAVLWRLRDRPLARPGVLTRLDKDTSGLVLLALGPAVHALIQAGARTGHVRKEYLAVVAGTPRPAAGRIMLALGRDPRDRRRVIPRADGAHSETRYEVVSAGADTSLVRCELVTGRTHQIRVHLSASGWPIVGDRTYGTADARIARQALHAWRIQLDHPVTGERVVVTAPVAPDMQSLLASL